MNIPIGVWPYLLREGNAASHFLPPWIFPEDWNLWSPGPNLKVVLVEKNVQ